MSKPFLGSFGVKLLLFLNKIMIEVKADSRLLLIFLLLDFCHVIPCWDFNYWDGQFETFFQEKVKFWNLKNKKVTMRSADRQHKISNIPDFFFEVFFICKISDIFVKMSAHAMRRCHKISTQSEFSITSHKFLSELEKFTFFW